MPPQTLLDIGSIDTTATVVTREQIYDTIPHRYEFALLDGFCHLDLEAREMAAYKEICADEYWVRGHIPGRPLLPGVLMIEASAQMISYFVKLADPHEGFMGFGGVDNVKFRGQVVPGDRLLLLGRMEEIRPGRRAIGAVQGLVNGTMVYEGRITGMMV